MACPAACQRGLRPRRMLARRGPSAPHCVPGRSCHGPARALGFWQATLLIESAHQQQVSSKAYENRDPCAAQGTSLATIPHSGHDTLKASLRTYAFMPPTSQHLQSRTPRPASYRGASLPHFPHLHDRALYGSASMTRAPAPSIAMPGP